MSAFPEVYFDLSDAGHSIGFVWILIARRDWLVHISL
jgi:hypothetical protein